MKNNQVQKLGSLRLKYNLREATYISQSPVIRIKLLEQKSYSNHVSHCTVLCGTTASFGINVDNHVTWTRNKLVGKKQLNFLETEQIKHEKGKQ